MGVAISKLEDDKALLLCRDRKRFVKQTLDGRCSLAAAHITYMQALRSTGTALRRFVEYDCPSESSLYTSTMTTPEPATLVAKSPSHLSHTSPSLSSSAASPYAGRLQIKYMKANKSSSTIVEEAPPASVTATLVSPLGTPQKSIPQSTEASSLFGVPPPPSGTPPWDFFGLFHPIDNHFSFEHRRASGHELENADDIQRLREEEGIPDLEEEEERVGLMRTDYEASDLDSEESSGELSFQSPRKQIDGFNSYSPIPSPNLGLIESLTQKPDHLNDEKKISNENVEALKDNDAPDMASFTSTPHIAPSTEENKEVVKKHTLEKYIAPKDILSTIKEIEYLFLKASEAGNKVLSMLEANNVHYHPLPETKARRSGASMLFTTCFVCFEDPQHAQDEPATNTLKYLTRHRSAAPYSSSSRNLLGSSERESVVGSSSDLFNSFCMNSGSHTSTLDRLYAWERKLYDEVKASGIIRREYDNKCKQLRHQDSKGESHYKIDRTRAVIKDLHSRIKVAIHRIDSISKRIEELRDEELQPQLEELINGLRQMWEMMLESYKLQFKMISVAYNNETIKISIQAEAYRQAIIHLEHSINSLCLSFVRWISAHKSYLQAINRWLLKCVFPLQQKTSKKRQLQFSPRRYVAPPIFITCQNWLNGLEVLEENEAVVAESMKELAAVAIQFLPQEEKTHRKKSKSTFSSVPWAADINSEAALAERNRRIIDRNVDFQRLQPSLVGIFKQLNGFAESSIKMYADLQSSIREAHQNYDQKTRQV